MGTIPKFLLHHHNTMMPIAKSVLLVVASLAMTLASQAEREPVSADCSMTESRCDDLPTRKCYYHGCGDCGFCPCQCPPECICNTLGEGVLCYYHAKCGCKQPYPCEDPLHNIGHNEYLQSQRVGRRRLLDIIESTLCKERNA